MPQNGSMLIVLDVLALLWNTVGCSVTRILWYHMLYMKSERVWWRAFWCEQFCNEADL